MTAFFSRTIIALGVFGLVTSVAVSAGQTGKSADLLTAKQVKELVSSANTPADHTKLSKHLSALAAKYEADAAEHVALSAVYRKTPSASETKPPGTPDTAAHCDRFAESTRSAATEARDLAAAHAHMATAKKHRCDSSHRLT